MVLTAHFHVRLVIDSTDKTIGNDWHCWYVVHAGSIPPFDTTRSHWWSLGGTGAGKTTLARKLYEFLGGDANVNYLVHDCYYKDISHKPFEERAKTNFDHPEVGGRDGSLS